VVRAFFMPWTMKASKSAAGPAADWKITAMASGVATTLPLKPT
jgi:hypothetical protein